MSCGKTQLETRRRSLGCLDQLVIKQTGLVCQDRPYVCGVYVRRQLDLRALFLWCWEQCTTRYVELLLSAQLQGLVRSALMISKIAP